MALDPVPWMVTGGEHSAEVGRMLAYIACGGSEGVVATGDLKVRASDVPDGNIHVQPGAVACLNRFPGGGQQAYVVRNIADTVVALSPQGSSGARYDLIAVLVEDPEYPGQPDPVSVADGPYVRINVYSNVPETTTTLAEVDADQTGYALARVKFDASDGTVLSTDITDLRSLLNPKSSTSTSYPAITYSGGGSPGTADALAVNDPVPAAGTNDVFVPTWCNRMVFTIGISGLVLGDLDTAGVAPSGSGGLKAVLGTLESAEFPLTLTPENVATASSLEFSGYSYPAPVVEGAKFGVFGSVGGDNATAPGGVGAAGGFTLTWTVDIPEELRGTTQQFHVKLSSRTVGAGQDLWVWPGAYMQMTSLAQQSLESAL